MPYLTIYFSNFLKQLNKERTSYVLLISHPLRSLEMESMRSQSSTEFVF